jgi:hypothetical protein
VWPFFFSAGLVFFLFSRTLIVALLSRGFEPHRRSAIPRLHAAVSKIDS